jgi:hypothetical protein
VAHYTKAKGKGQKAKGKGQKAKGKSRRQKPRIPAVFTFAFCP